MDELDDIAFLAEIGYDPAQLELAQMYALGIGRPQDEAEATKWFRKAAEQGAVEA